MHELNFDRLQRRLLLGGVAPRYAKRTVTELKSHFAELVLNEKEKGLSDQEAKQNSFATLGNEDRIVEEALAKPAIKSWSHRFTKTIFLGAPAILYVAIVFSFLYVMTVLSENIFAIDVRTNWPAWHFWLSKVVMFSIEYLFSPLLVLFFSTLAVRRNVDMLWPMIGIGIMCFLGSGWETVVSIPVEPRSGGIQLTWGYAFLPWRYVQVDWLQTIEQLVRFSVVMLLVWKLPNYYKPLELNS